MSYTTKEKQVLEALQQNSEVVGRKLGYKRVSTKDKGQLTEHQLENLNLDLIFEDKMSGRDTEGRVGLKACLEELRTGDTLYVQDMSRLARNAEQALGIIRQISDRGVALHLCTEGLHFYGKDGINDVMSEMMLKILAIFAELFSKLHAAAVKRGMAYSKKEKGTKFGAASDNYNRKELTERNKRVNTKARTWAEKWRKQIELMVDLGMTLREMASKLCSIGAKTQQGKLYNHNSVNNLCKLLDIDRKTFKLGGDIGLVA